LADRRSSEPPDRIGRSARIADFAEKFRDRCIRLALLREIRGREHEGWLSEPVTG
jgi:hypothetical protein